MYLNQLKKEIINAFDKFDENTIIKFSKLINKYKNNNIFFLGVGKSENIAKHTSDIFKSLGYSSFLLNHTNCLHGDLGCIKKNDLAIFISKSGESSELINPLKYINKKDIETLGIFCKINSSLEKECNSSIILPLTTELDPNFNLVPTTSVIIYNIFFSLATRHLFDLGSISLENYGRNHPVGYIGKKIWTIVQDKFIEKENTPIFLLDKTYTFYDIIEKMTNCHIGLAIFIDIDDYFIGIITDGDIRREIHKNGKLDIDIKNIINKNASIMKHPLNYKVKDIVFDQNYRFFPIVHENKYVGIYKNF
jgi:arabinose-5-phosphate isomerase